MMTEREIAQILENCGAFIQNSHIVYTSGKHGSVYVNKDAVYPRTEITSKLCLEMARRFEKEPIDAVIAPAVGGVILSQWVAHHLSGLKKKQVLGVYAEKLNDGFVIKRGYDELIRGKNVLVAEDILTTGGSVKKVVEAVKAIPAKVVGVAALCNRGGVTEKDLGAPLNALLTVSFEAVDPASCELCRKKVPINQAVGKGG